MRRKCYRKTFFFIISRKSIKEGANTWSPDIDETRPMDGVTTGSAGVNGLKKRPSSTTALLGSMMGWEMARSYLAICRSGRGKSWFSWN